MLLLIPHIGCGTPLIPIMVCVSIKVSYYPWAVTCRMFLEAPGNICQVLSLGPENMGCSPPNPVYPHISSVKTRCWIDLLQSHLECLPLEHITIQVHVTFPQSKQTQQVLPYFLKKFSALPPCQPWGNWARQSHQFPLLPFLEPRSKPVPLVNKWSQSLKPSWPHLTCALESLEVIWTLALSLTNMQLDTLSLYFFGL